jgi:protein required for attachment to host cells
MKKTWILIADAHRARCFERHVSDHSLHELADFVHPKTNLVSAADKGHGRTGHAGTQFEPQTEVNAKERNHYARQLADYLNEAVAGQRCTELVVIATSPMMGEIKHYLSQAAENVLKRCITSDLTHYTGPELKKRVDHALELPND